MNTIKIINTCFQTIFFITCTSKILYFPKFIGHKISKIISLHTNIWNYHNCIFSMGTKYTLREPKLCLFLLLLKTRPLANVQIMDWASNIIFFKHNSLQNNKWWFYLINHLSYNNTVKTSEITQNSPNICKINPSSHFFHLKKNLFIL